MPRTTNNLMELPQPPALPTTTSAMLALRKLKSKRTINDLVEDAYLQLIEDEKFSRLQYAIYNAQAVEKDCKIDDILSAEMIRSHAEENGITELAQEPLKAIVMALHVVTRRYGVSRQERREMAGPVVTPASQDDDAAE